MLLIEFLFWIALVLIFHSYIIYPLIIRFIASFLKNNEICYSKNEKLPKVSIIMAAHNEEKVIQEKLESIIASNYPFENIEILIGSDCSTDSTNQIINTFAQKDQRIIFIPFTVRTGKIGIVNQLFEKANGEILLLTDANVILQPNTIFELIKHFKNEKISLVDSFMKHRNLKIDGISNQESGYISNEVKTKHAEGKLWGSLMGPFGGCFAIRKVDFEAVPSKFLVDDFYTCMKVLQKRKACISEPNAIVVEDVSNNLQSEFKRKIRISAGNFQNLVHFSPLLLRFNAVSFAFLSHKVLRWKTPFLIIFILVAFPFLMNYKDSYRFFGYFILLIGLCLQVDFIFKKINIHISILRYLTHFAAMNLALLLGFVKFLSGVKSSVWEPTERNQ